MSCASGRDYCLSLPITPSFADDRVLLAVEAAWTEPMLQLRRVQFERRVAASEGLADATVRLNQRLREVTIDLAAQSANVNLRPYWSDPRKKSSIYAHGSSFG
jgi:hypothetical protein